MKVRIVLSMLVLTLGLLALTDAQGQIITSVVRSGGAIRRQAANRCLYRRDPVPADGAGRR